MAHSPPIQQKNLKIGSNPLGSEDSFSRLIGKNSGLKECITQARVVANFNTNILLTGESGTGKELFARAIHDASPRWEKHFVPINCGAIPKELVESELFGYDKGAFTGANTKRIGHFEAAHQGTLLLDEIGEMPDFMQVKLLRAIEQKEFFPLGSSSPTTPDFRIISATNKNIAEAVKNNLFRSDLYYRINIFQIEIPPLRNRREDISLLSNYFIETFCNENNTKPIPVISNEALTILENYSWPGNVRELDNVCQRCAVMAFSKGKSHIDASMLPPEIISESLNFDQKDKIIETISRIVIDNKISLGTVQDSLIRNAFYLENSNIAKAASLLGIPRSRMSRWVKKMGLKQSSLFSGVQNK